MHDMNKKIGVGTFWNLLNLTLNRGATVIFTLVLARFLAPEAFGLIAMITICFQLGLVIATSGLGQALIRSKDVDQTDLSTVFFANLVLSGVAYVLLVIVAPWIANFYDQPELTLLIRVVGIVIFTNALKIVQIAVLSRQMNFKSQMQANGAGVVVSGVVAILLAYLGFGVWSLAAQMVLSSVVSSWVLWHASSWRPTRSFSWHSFHRLFAFGSRLLTEGILNTLYENSYIIVIGRVFSAELTGLYFFATRIIELVSQQLTSAIQQASFPALATLQDDKEALRFKFRQILQLTLLVIAPSLALLAALSDPLFALALDSHWQDAIPYLQLFCVIGVLYPLHAMNVNILKAMGRSDLILKVGLLKKAVSLALLFAAIPYGVFAIAISQVIGSVLALIPNAYYSAKLIDYKLSEQLSDASKPGIAATIAGAISWGLVQTVTVSAVGKVALGGLVGLTMYAILSYLFKAEGLHLVYTRIRPSISNL